MIGDSFGEARATAAYLSVGIGEGILRDDS